jgi:hypothetical protein
LEDEDEFSAKAFTISKGTSCRMSEVTPQAFEYGQDVMDTETGKSGQVRFIVWNCRREIWLYCISGKDIDHEERWVEESHLKLAPAQTRIDKTGKTILYAPRKLKHQQRRLTQHVKRVNIKDKYNSESWQSRQLIQ